MADVMLDLETIGVDPDSCVISIGAVAFNKYDEPGRLGEKFFAAITMDSVEYDQVRKWKRFVSPTTVAWWMDQSGAAQRASFANPEAGTTLLALTNFAKFLIRNPQSAIWGNGATFDNVILANLYNATNAKEAPWHFTADRCYRTMKNLGYGPASRKQEGVLHNPLDDAVSQAIHLQQIMEAIRTNDKVIRAF